jgi:hypothetical protein
MNNEIKEILNKLKDKNNYISHSMILLSDKETKQLLDYITKLQSKIEAYELFDNQKIARYNNLKEEHKDTITVINYISHACS